MFNADIETVLVGRPGPLRDGLASLLAAMGLTRLTTADGSLLALKTVSRVRPTCVLLAGGLPNAEALELVQRIKQEQPSLRLLALADGAEQRRALLKAGADRVIPTGTPFNQLISSMQLLLQDTASSNARPIEETRLHG